MDASRRRLCAVIPIGLAALLLPGARRAFGQALPGAAAERVVKIEAQKFVYTPNRIELKKGEAVVLELHALDFTHGFNIPDLHIRADLLQGKITQVRLTPDAAGEFTFMCDNFCGSGHEEMHGTISVRE